jgi:protein TonB
MKKLLVLFILFSSVKFFAQESTHQSNPKEYIQITGETVAVYKGCENNTSNKDLKQCMSDEISRHFQRNFRISRPPISKLRKGIYAIKVIFKIDKEGKITSERAKAKTSDLEKEALRVVALIPQMVPGKRNGKPTVVPYFVPINIQIGGN